MKKLLVVLSLTALLILGLAGSTLAGTAYLDYAASGTWDAEGDDGDTTGFIVGANGGTDMFYFGIEYAALTWQDTPAGDLDCAAIDLRGGYLVMNDDTTQLSLGLGYISFDASDGPGEITGYGLAVDLITGSDQFLFEGGLGYTLSATTDPGDTDADVSYYKLRFTYLFTESFGLTLGYRNYTISIDGAGDMITSAISLGGTYKF